MRRYRQRVRHGGGLYSPAVNVALFPLEGEAINRAVARFHAHTGRFVREAISLKTELGREGIEFDALRDPWGQPYQIEFGVSQTKYFVFVRSSGPDREFLSKQNDDVLLWTSSIDYSIDVQAKIESALTAYSGQRRKCRRMMPSSRGSTSVQALPGRFARSRGRPYSATFMHKAIYSDR